MSELVSIVCVTHERRDLVMKCLESCVVQDYPNKEILVVLNPSNPETELELRSRFNQIRILQTHRNIGFFPALNLAIANCKGDFVMIVDDDARFLSNDAVSRLVRCFHDEPKLGAVTCSLEGPHERPIQREDHYIRTFTTGFTMLPRKVMTEWVGYVPDLFFRSAGETFWCMQLWEQRRPVKRVVEVRMFHELSMEGRSTRDWYFHALRSQLLCAVMREPPTWLIPVLLSKLMKSFLKYFKDGMPILWAEAWLSFLFHIGEALRLRKPISSQTRKLLHQLDRHKVGNLSELREWQELTQGEPTSRGVERQVI